MPIIVEAGCPFKVIANTALLELAWSKWTAEDRRALHDGLPGVRGIV